jgi:pyruvate/2-oxoglutarate dehydrogenase complex dihydrolipoamide dehydrogenase (E3) component
MLETLIQLHMSKYKDSGAELILGEGRFVGSKTLEVESKAGNKRHLTGDRVFLNVGTHAAIPDIPEAGRRSDSSGH